jgi:hypothetical protein
MKRHFAILVFFALLWAAPALAQGCAMCYNTAAASTKDGQRAISQGVLILLVPPVGLMTAGVGWAIRYGNRRDREWRKPPAAPEFRPLHSPEAMASSPQSPPVQNASSAPV